ncbi:MAG: hypothetical protein D6798_06865 [Deltaproteobacteria bacterium]|nr:MAG: hypothetical protein D6798_06865 [Deltaproteobacteria bacterium]
MVLLVLTLACRPDGGASPSETGRDTGIDTGAPTAPTAVDVSPLSVAWRWSAGGLDADRLRRGFDWDLSWLGALPPPDGGHLVPIDDDGPTRVFQLDPAALGLPDRALPALTDALVELRQWSEWRGHVDLGRLLMRTLHEPWYYYAITGACADLDQWRQQRGSPEWDRYDVVVSQLASGGRVVWLPPAGTPVAELGFLVGTGTAPLGDGWQAEEFETVDLMANGQQRFAAWSADGRLEPAANPEVVAAGTAGNCLWCHEDHLMTGTPDNPSTDTALSYEEWAARIDGWQAELQAWRSSLQTSIDTTDHDVHADGELVVREFLLPTVDRVAAEWGVDEEQARSIIAERGLTLETDAEWPGRGAVLRRSEVDAVLAERLGRAPPAVLDDARHLADDEPLRGAEWAGFVDCSG